MSCRLRQHWLNQCLTVRLEDWHFCTQEKESLFSWLSERYYWCMAGWLFITHHHLTVTWIWRNWCCGSQARITEKKGKFQFVVMFHKNNCVLALRLLFSNFWFNLHNPGPDLKSTGFLNIYHSQTEDHVWNLLLFFFWRMKDPVETDWGNYKSSSRIT